MESNEKGSDTFFPLIPPVRAHENDCNLVFGDGTHRECVCV